MTRPFTISTDRLTIRMLGRGDVTEFVRYRNVPAVAEYQDWPLPYTRDLAHQLIDQLEPLAGPTAGGWVQLAVEHDQRLIGDLAVWLDADGRLATIGYTLSPEQQGRGYATEAVGALVDRLFAHGAGGFGVARVAATIDPANLASARVLDATGFGYVGTATRAAFVRGAWSDDARFSLLADQRAAWVARPTRPPASVELFEPTHADLRDLLAIEVGFAQRGLVSPVSASLAEALLPPRAGDVPLTPWYRGVRADGTTVGFVMVAEPSPNEPRPYLWRFSIDRAHQGRGIGREALTMVRREWAGWGATELVVSYVDGLPGSPAAFYRRAGFVPTGELDGDEVVAVARIDR